MDRRRALRLIGGAVAITPLHLGRESRPGAPATSLRSIEPVGLQLYTVRAEMREDFDGTLARVAAIGYREVEFAGYFDRSPAAVRQSLRDAGLTSPATHVPAIAVLQDWARTLDEAADIGCRYVVGATLSTGNAVASQAEFARGLRPENRDRSRLARRRHPVPPRPDAAGPEYDNVAAVRRIHPGFPAATSRHPNVPKEARSPLDCSARVAVGCYVVSHHGKALGSLRAGVGTFGIAGGCFAHHARAGG